MADGRREPLPSERIGIPIGRLRRLLPLAGTTARSAAGRVGMRLTRNDERELALLVREAERYAAVLGDMKGAAMKVGQVLSFLDADLVPERFRDAYRVSLSMLQADAPAMAPDVARAVVEAELGAPIDEVFAWFAPQPMAAASIGQVHAAHLRDGREVAVKVQYPGAAAAVAADLANADVLVQLARTGMRLLGPLAPRTDPRVIVEEVRDRVLEELDYEQEAANQTEFAARYAAEPGVRIPGVVAELTTRRVLTQELVDGMRWSAALACPQQDKDRWGYVIDRFVYTAMHRDGLFNADPHPGNYLFHEDGTVTFLDFGCVKRFDDAERFTMACIVLACADRDASRLRAECVAVGLLDDDAPVSADRLLDWYSVLMAPVVEPQPWTYTPAHAARVVAASYDLTGEWGDVLRHLRLPPAYVMNNRIQLGLNSVLGALGATADWRAVFDDVVRDVL